MTVPSGRLLAECPPVRLTAFGGQLEVTLSDPVCLLGVETWGHVTAAVGPFLVGVCLGLMALGTASLLGATGLGLALRGLLHRVRHRFARRLPPVSGSVSVRVAAPPAWSTLRLVADRRPTIVSCARGHRGPPPVAAAG